MQKNPLFFVFVLPVIFDIVGTVTGQSPEYWTSNFHLANEALPIRFLLQIHPLVFIIVCLTIWLMFTYMLVKKLKSPLSLWATMALFAGHAYNSINWFRISLVKVAHPGTDVISQTVLLIPVFLYVLVIGKIAARALITYYHQSPPNL